VSGASLFIKMLRVNTLPIVPDPQAKLPLAIPDFRFDPLRLRVLEGIAHRLAGYPLDFVSQYRMEVTRRAFYLHMKLGSIRALKFPNGA
jgi:hypothetical protein